MIECLIVLMVRANKTSMITDYCISTITEVRKDYLKNRDGIKITQNLSVFKIHTFFLNTLTGCKNVMFAKIFDSLCLC